MFNSEPFQFLNITLQIIWYLWLYVMGLLQLFLINLNIYLNFAVISNMIIKWIEITYINKTLWLVNDCEECKRFLSPKNLIVSFNYNSFLIDVLQFITKVFDVSKSFTTVVIVKFRNMFCFIFFHHLVKTDTSTLSFSGR